MSALFGVHVVVARDDAPDDDISRAVLAAGAVVVPLSAMQVVDVDDRGPLLAAAAAVDSFDLVCFTSRHAVAAFARAALAKAPRAIAAVGPRTAAACRDHGWSVEIVGDGGGARLAELLLARRSWGGARVLLPRAAAANDDLRAMLADAGATVVVVDAYRSVPRADLDAALGVLWRDTPAPRAMVVTSPQRAQLVARVAVPVDVWTVALGSTTAQALRDARMRVDVVAQTPTPAAVVEAVASRKTKA